MEKLYPGHLIDGVLCEPAEPDGVFRSRCPGELSVTVREQPVAHTTVELSVGAAVNAARRWRSLEISERIEHLVRFREVLHAYTDELGRVISLEVGKVLREGIAEAKAMVSKVDIAVNEGLALTREVSLDDGRMGWRWRPHGVLAVIGPFNFPLHLGHGHIVPALLAGNTVVFKPSEVTPGCGALYARLAHLAGLPAGVLNVIHGGSVAGERLVTHPDVDGVLFTGSYTVGRKILEATAAEPGKIVALELGGVNHAVVLEDAPFDKALADVAMSAFVTSGQRCTCASRVVVERPIAEAFIARLTAVARGLRVGHPFDPGVFTGPVASRAAMERFERVEALAETEGVALIEAPRDVVVEWQGRRCDGYYLSPRVRRVTTLPSGSAWRDTEVFGPSVSVHVVDSLDEALGVVNASRYGLSAGLWTRSEDKFSYFASEVQAGSITLNAPTAGASSRLPFGGIKRSGNHRPAGVFSSLYCAWPMAFTKGRDGLDSGALPAGLPRDVFVTGSPTE